MTYHLIVCCVKSKHLQGPSFQQITPGPLQKVHQEWFNALQRARAVGPKYSARHLYKGAVWKSYLDIYEGLPGPKCLWVISAGYGLVAEKDLLSGYEATFQNDTATIHGHIQETGSDAEISQLWWEALTQNPPLGNDAQPRSLAKLMKRYKKDRFVLVASKAYLNAISLDLAEGLNQLASIDSFLMISNNKDMRIPATTEQWPGLLPYIHGAEKTFQCSRLTVNGQIANFLIRKILPETNWNHAEFALAVRNLERIESIQEPVRERLSDEAVQSRIIEYLKWAIQPSKSAALRHLRSQGEACEQKRFGELYEQIIAAN
ncbi:MAG: hypothetical protein ACO1RX_08240 [Candidatus Sericytochromatia bacterium]